MNRDIIIQPITESKKLVIATDCSGSCGLLQQDEIKVPLSVSSYYTARVAFMEILSAGAVPVSYTVSNFVADGYEEIHKGIQQVINELGLDGISHISSSETNFKMVQSAVGVTVIGVLNGEISDDAKGLNFACIGSPLVGNEVVEKQNEMLKINDFANLVKDTKAKQIVPVGSKGVAYKLKQVFDVDALSSTIDLQKSAGPASCIILGYNTEDENYFAEKYGKLFNPIKTRS